MTLGICLCILEDDPAWSIPILNSIKRNLTYCTVRTATNGKAFCRLILDSPLPDLIVLDINTPGMNGIEVLRKIKSREDLKWLPVVMFSSDYDAGTRIKCIDLGAIDYVVKSPDNIARDLKDMVEKHAYKGEKPAVISPPLLVESKPLHGNSSGQSIDDMLADL